MTSRSSRSWIIISIIALIAIGLLVYLSTLEYKTIELNQGPDSKVNQQPFLAAQTLINQQQGEGKMQTQQGFALLTRLPSHQDVILIEGRRSSLTKQKTDELVNWIENGGHLIVTGSPTDTFYDNEVDFLFSKFGITTKEDPRQHENNALEQLQDLQSILGPVVDDPAKQDITVEQELLKQSQRQYFTCDHTSDILQFSLDNSALSIYVGKQHYYYLESNTDKSEFNFAFGNYNQYKLLQRPVGKGRLTIVNTMWMWRNRQFACQDHAFLLHSLTKDANKIWWLYNEEMPGLMYLLWQNAKWLVLSVLLVLALWIWSQTLRFGRLLHINRTSRRNYVEHLTAAAKYRFYCGESEQLIDMLRQQILHKLALKHRELSTLPAQQQCELISRLCDLDSAQIFEAMFVDVPTKPEQTVKLVQKLQRLRKQLC